MDENENLISDKGIIANTFNLHFSTIGSNVGNSILPGQGHFSDFLNLSNVNNRPFLESSASFFLIPTIPEEIDF